MQLKSFYVFVGISYTETLCYLCFIRVFFFFYISELILKFKICRGKSKKRDCAVQNIRPSVIYYKVPLSVANG